MSQAAILPEVLTLQEVADYLRLPKDAVARQATLGQLPGRCIEADWRFHKDAIEEWLKRREDSRMVLLQQAGSLADDETLSALRAAIYAERGRPEIAEAP
jgi:excisionase family DNA binding protein